MLDDRGTFTLYDASLFFIFLIIASSIFSVYSVNLYSGLDDRAERADYCDYTRQAILSSTVRETDYIYENETIFRRDFSVRYLLIEQVYLESCGVERENFSYSDDISQLVRGHMEEEKWYLVVSSPLTEELVIGRDGIKGGGVDRVSDRDLITSSCLEEGFGDERVEIIFYLYD